MMTLKERKEMEDAFKKAQKPWAKLLQKVEKAKAEYHNSCKTERTAANMERNASADSSLSPDQVQQYLQILHQIQNVNQTRISVYAKLKVLLQLSLPFFRHE